MKSVFRVRTVIEAIENIPGRAAIVQRREFRRIEKTTGALETKGHEVSDMCVAVTKRSVLAGGSESSIRRAETSRRFLLIQTRLCDCVHDETCLVAILSRSCAGDDFERLNRAGRQLRRKRLALLIGNGLIVDRIRRLRVIAKRMEKSIRVGDHARRRKRYDITQARARRSHNLRAINVGPPPNPVAAGRAPRRHVMRRLDTARGEKWSQLPQDTSGAFREAGPAVVPGLILPP